MGSMVIFGVIGILSCFAVVSTRAQLQNGFYDHSCPKAEKLIKEFVHEHIPNAPSLAAALLRMHFHDCFVRVRINYLLSYCKFCNKMHLREWVYCFFRVVMLLFYSMSLPPTLLMQRREPRLPISRFEGSTSLTESKPLSRLNAPAWSPAPISSLWSPEILSSSRFDRSTYICCKSKLRNVRHDIWWIISCCMYVCIYIFAGRTVMERSDGEKRREYIECDGIVAEHSRSHFQFQQTDKFICQ